MNVPQISLNFAPADEPLLSRVPTTDEDGKPLGDMMVILPGLRGKTQPQINKVIEDIHEVLNCFASTVMFAEVNLQRSLLWVSVRPIAGIRATIASALGDRVPGAKLISHI